MSSSPQFVGPTEPQTRAEQSLVLICIPTATMEEGRELQTRFSSVFADRTVSFAFGEEMFQSNAAPGGAAANGSDPTWTLSAMDYTAAARLALERSAAATMLLGTEAFTVSEAALQDLVAPVLVGEADLVLPGLQAGPTDALVSSALLYPFTRALFSVTTHLPLPLDAAFSPRFASRAATIAGKAQLSQGNTLLWPVSEAATASLRTHEAAPIRSMLPHPPDRDLQSLLAEVIGSLFADLEAKANFWQRGRAILPAELAAEVRPDEAAAENEKAVAPEVASMVDAFRGAYDDLHEIWSLVLPPQSLFRVKRLSRTAATDFTFPPDLWARTAYDFLLAFHQRTINRGHLLGAMTPLYLGWVASHIRLSAGDAALARRHVEECADAFIAEKPYLVSRWRWPDRFNP